MQTIKQDSIREQVRLRYGAIAAQDDAGGGLAGCCPPADVPSDLSIEARRAKSEAPANAVINLSPDKPRVFREAFRALKPGGRLSISDIIARRPLPAHWREDHEQFTRCISGAELGSDLERWMKEAGFATIRIVPNEESRKFIDTWVGGKNLGNCVVSAMIEARKL